MTEAEWLTKNNPSDLIDGLFLEDVLPVLVSERKLLLFAVGCCRCLCDHLDSSTCRPAVEVVERRIEGLATAEEMEESRNAVRGRMWANQWRNITEDAEPFWFAVSSLLDMDGWKAAEDIAAPMSAKPNLSAAATSNLRCVLGNPFRPLAVDPSWLTSTVVALAEGIYADRAFDRMPILADALQDAGCDNADVLNHCRSDGPHVRGCWVVDLLLGLS